ncbi:MAG: hypothetical protein ABIO39_08005 [Caulobacteraceae bacterium]
MIRRAILALAAVTAVGSAAPAVAAEACDRACLKGMVDAYLAAMLKHSPAGLPLASNVRFTEDLKEMKLGEGLWKDASKLRAYRQDFIDVRTGQAGAHVIVEQNGQPALLALRLKVADRKITEVETQVSRNKEEGVIFELAGLEATQPLMNRAPTAAERNNREELIKAASAYPAGLQAGSFAGAPFADDAYRLENGAFMAGANCTRNAECKNMRTQAIGGGRKGFQERLVLVDEEQQIVWYRMSWGRGEDRRLVVFEAFKVLGGKVVGVEAFMRLEPFDSTSGWG